MYPVIECNIVLIDKFYCIGVFNLLTETIASTTDTTEYKRYIKHNRKSPEVKDLGKRIPRTSNGHNTCYKIPFKDIVIEQQTFIQIKHNIIPAILFPLMHLLVGFVTT